ncbi:hypothetical protein HPP92_023369 [Vanilla planifolia]|uniref:NPH3 domain-containing protein n=1 Tax=Vanilla planifolia TaxID=51239 RepID=A0A835UE29_VANPL|nr:hypothetical protein HPP92_023369 [Vanilla planifolia]
MTILEEFMIQSASPPTSPLRERYGSDLPRRSRSAENIDFELQEHGRRSSSASHSAKLRVAKLIDLYLQEIASDPALPIENVLFLGEAVPDFARMNHDDLYRVIDTYLRAHPGLDKNERKRLCSIVDCKKLSVETCMHAAQNDQLPLRMVVQVLFFEQARAAMAGGQVAELPSNIKELLAKTEKGGGMKDEWIETAAMKCPSTKLATLRMKLAEYEDDVEDEAMRREGLTRSSSSRLRALCSIPSKPKRILSKFWSMNRSVSEKQRCL